MYKLVMYSYHKVMSNMVMYDMYNVYVCHGYEQHVYVCHGYVQHVYGNHYFISVTTRSVKNIDILV